MKRTLQNLELLSVEQVATMLNVSSKTVRRMIERRELHHHRIGRVVRISAEDLRSYASSTRQ